MESLNVAGQLDTHKVAAALMYSNTQLQKTGHSPVEILYGMVLRDHLPTSNELHMSRPEWMSMMHDREIALSKCNVRNHGA